MVFAWTWGMILNGCYKVIKVERSGLGINSPQEPVCIPWPCPEPRKNWSTLWVPSSRDTLDIWVFWLTLSKGRKYSSDSVPNQEMTFSQHSCLQPSFPTVLQSQGSPGPCWEQGWELWHILWGIWGFLALIRAFMALGQFFYMLDSWFFLFFFFP